MSKVLKSVNNQEFIVLKAKGADSVIRFVETGYECRAKNHLIKSGRVYDPTSFIREAEAWKDVHIEFTNNDGEMFYAFKKKGNKIRVVFPKTNYVAEVYLANAQAGKVKDPYSISVFAHGYIGNIDKSIPYWKQAKQLWQNMMKRCYCEADKRGYYGKAYVDDRWKMFENFLNDIKNLDGFHAWLNAEDNGIKFNLDKDFIKPDNKIYSRDFCCFLPENFNKALGKKNKTESDWAKPNEFRLI